MTRLLKHPLTWIVLAGGALAAAYLGYKLLSRIDLPSPRGNRVIAWINDPGQHPEWANTHGAHCGTAPFIFPTDGYVGYLWGDMFHIGQRHQGIDIFGGTQPGVTPVVAAYPGYLTRLPAWKSSVIIRIPHDPLQPARQIWTYYTHMADSQGSSLIDAAFPPGSTEVPIEAGTLLGHQGDYSGDPTAPVGVHLHISIVRDDGTGHFTNELNIANTYDPSPYFNLPLNAAQNQNQIPLCR